MVKVYSKKICPYCVKVKSILEEEGIEYQEIDVTQDMNTFNKIAQETGFTTVPQVFNNDKFIGRSMDIEDLAEKGKLKEVCK